MNVKKARFLACARNDIGCSFRAEREIHVSTARSYLYMIPHCARDACGGFLTEPALSKVEGVEMPIAINISIVLLCLLVSFNVNAEITADQIARLGTELTPLGGEKAGNADGSITAWDGGLTQ